MEWQDFVIFSFTNGGQTNSPKQLHKALEKAAQWFYRRMVSDGLDLLED